MALQRREDCYLAIGTHLYPLVARIKKRNIWSGVYVDIMRDVMKLHNLCIDLVDSPIKSYGRKTENGTFDGALGYVERGEVDLFVNGANMKLDRINAVDFSEIAFFNSHSVLFGYPKSVADKSGHIKPFTWEVWVFLFFVLFLISGFFIFLLRCQKRRDEPKTNEIYKSIRITYGILLIQALPSLGVRGSSKIFLGFWVLLSVVIVGMYKCNLKAHLTSRKLDIPFYTVEDLPEYRGSLQLYVSEGTILAEYVREADPNSLYGKLKKNIRIFKFNEVTKIVQKIDNYEAAIAGPTMPGLGFTHISYAKFRKCKRALMKTNYLESIQGFVFKRNSSLKSLFNRVILAYKESGIMDILMKKYLYHAEKCNYGVYAAVGNRPLVFNDFFLVTMTLLVGYVVSVLAFIAEIVVGKRKKVLFKRRHPMVSRST